MANCEASYIITSNLFLYSSFGSGLFIISFNIRLQDWIFWALSNSVATFNLLLTSPELVSIASTLFIINSNCLIVIYYWTFGSFSIVYVFVVWVVGVVLLVPLVGAVALLVGTGAGADGSYVPWVCICCCCK